MLSHRFLTAYGFEKGPVLVEAIVDDILELIEQYYVTPEQQYVGQIVWLAAHKEETQRQGKSIATTRMLPIKLSLLTTEDYQLLAEGASSHERQRQRICRLFHEAYEQDALLTYLEVAMLVGWSEDAVGKVVRRERQKGNSIPTRGWVHDLGRGPSHKGLIIELYLRGYLTPDIAARTYHHPFAVDRYIKDFEVVRGLTQRFSAQEIPPLARMQPGVVNEYLTILKEHDLLPKPDERVTA
jgi:hypothetical protein